MSKLRVRMVRAEGRWDGREVWGIWVNHLLTKAFGERALIWI